MDHVILKMAGCKFVKELPDDYLCVICTEVLNEPHLTDCCGQHFCQVCLEQWFKKQQKKICPHCRSQSFSHISYIPLKRKVNALEVYCPNQKEGCKVVLKLGELNSHKSECGFVHVICSQGCGKSICRKDLMCHYINECSKREIMCEYCGKVDHFETITGKHTTVCEEYPVDCPRGCTHPSGFKRKNLAKHAEICPLENVQCPFHDAGCDTTVLRKDLNAHIESSTQLHLMKMLAAFKQLSSQVASLTLIEPVKLTNEDSSFSFSLTSSKGWVSPPFCVLDGYKFCIKHKDEREASLMLLSGKNDGDLKWPMNLQYRLEVMLEKQHGMVQQARRSMTQCKRILDFHLSANIECTAIDDCRKEIASITLPEKELLNYKVIVKLVPTVGKVEDHIKLLPSVRCPHCMGTIVDHRMKYCLYCGTMLK